MPAIELPTARTLSVVDATLTESGEATFAIWHIELTTDITTGRLSGAWLLNIPESGSAVPGEIAPDVEKLKSLLALTPVHATDAAREGLAGLAGSVPELAALAQLQFVDADATTAALRDNVEAMMAAAKAYKAAGNAVQAPRFPKVPDLAPLDTHYNGEVAGKVAHAWAMAWRELIGTWLDIVSVRRRRKYLSEFGPTNPDTPEYFPLVTMP